MNYKNVSKEAVKMKKKKYLTMLLCVCACFIIANSIAFAADKNIYAESTAQETFPIAVSMQLAERNGMLCLEKDYQLTKEDDLTQIPKDDIRWDGKTYVFTDLVRSDPAPVTEVHTETITFNSSTNKLDQILKQMEAAIEVETEDGYTGKLHLVPESITVNAAGYRNQSYTICTDRTYPNLSDADTALLPKTVEEKGRTLTLSDVNWQSAATDQVDGYELAMRYTAVATYSVTGTSKVATGYVVTADYTGNVTKTESDTLLYTAIYTEKTNAFLEAMKQGNTLWLLLPIVFLIVLALYYGPKQYQHYINKKRGYEK